MTKESKARRRTLDDLTQEMIAADAGFKQAWDALEAKRKIVASLLRLRAKADFTQKELAERAGWHPSFVCRLESFPREGEQLYMPDLQTLMVYAQVCGSNLAMMFGEAEAGGLHITESVSLSSDARFAQAVGALADTSFDIDEEQVLSVEHSTA
ncbi:MAG TPA: helix-turn-helix transcriptional regulator [Kiloniellaceae bacterium]